MTRSAASDQPFSVPASRLFLALLAEGGSGPTNLNADYSVTPADAWVQSPPGFNVNVVTLDFFMQGPGNVFANNYGPITALTNGVILTIRNADDTNVNVPLTVRTTGEFAAIPGMSITSISAGPGDIYVNVTWSVALMAGSPIVLGPGMMIVATLQDNMSALTVHQIITGGHLTPAET